MDETLVGIDLIAFLLTALGYILSAQRKVICWPIWILGNAFWIIHWIRVGGEFYAMAMSALLVVIQVKGWYEWTIERRNEFHENRRN